MKKIFVEVIEENYVVTGLGFDIEGELECTKGEEIKIEMKEKSHTPIKLKINDKVETVLKYNEETSFIFREDVELFLYTDFATPCDFLKIKIKEEEKIDEFYNEFKTFRAKFKKEDNMSNIIRLFGIYKK